MRWRNQIRLRLRSLLFRSRVEAELREEFEFHLERQVEANITAGMLPEEARSTARRALEGMEQQKELCRDMRRTNFVDNLLKDTRYGLRTLRHSPGFSAAVILTLALGIGANAAIFSLIESLVLHPLPYPDANRLVALQEATRKGDHFSLSWPDFVDWRNQAGSFSAIAALQGKTANLTGNGEAGRLQILRVSAPFFSILGVHPLLGRDFTTSDDGPGATAAVAILSHSLWTHRFGSDAHVIGRTVSLNGYAYTIVGILPPSFRFLYPVELYSPIGIGADSLGGRGNHPGILAIGKLKPGVSLAIAKREMDGIARRLELAYPASNGGVLARVQPFAELVTAPVAPTLMILWSAVGFLLLIACANVANLLLARAASREREMSIRAAIGAGRGRLIQQLLTESSVLAVCGAVGGCLIAAALLPVLLRLLPSELREYVQTGINLRVLEFTLSLTVVTTVLFGLVPAYRMSPRKPNLALRSGTRASTGGYQMLSLRGVLVIGQIAVALMLLAGAGLLVQSVVRLGRVNPGFQAERVLTARLSLPDKKYSTTSQQTAFVDRLIEKIDAIPGVLSASGSYCLPLDVHGCWSSVFLIEGRPIPRTEDLFNAHFNGIEPDYLKTMGIPLVAGREFTPNDGPGSPMVVLVNQAFVRKFFPHEDPIGKRVKQDFPEGKTPYAAIVGVIGDARRDALDRPAQPEAFEALRQMGPDFMNLVVRTALPDPSSAAPAMRRELAGLDPDIPLFDVRSRDYYVSEQTANRRSPTVLLAAFAGAAVLLAVIGLYGLLSFLVTQRRQELGIRLALGAQTRDVTRLVMSQGLRLVLAGLVLGLGGAWATTRFIAALLFAIQPNDAWTFASVSCLLAVVAAVACWLPARRASAVDPVLTLRME